MKNYYSLLGVPKTASPEEIENAYQKTAKACATGSIPEPFATRILTDIREAYTVLIDPVRRSAYDAQNADAPKKDKKNPAISSSDDIYWDAPEMETDPHPDFTPAEYLMRLRVPGAVFGGLVAVVVTHVLCGAWMDAADYGRFFLRSSMIGCLTWVGYFIARVSVVSKGWLSLWLGLCSFAHITFTWPFLMGLWRIQYGRLAGIIGAFYFVLFFGCFVAAASFLERGGFAENVRKFGRGRFKKPGW
jgi:hypothetical protein